MTLSKQPKSMIVVGTGAIGVEFAYFYHTMGVEVTLVEFESQIVPREDAEIGKELEKIFKKKGLKIMTNSSVEKVTPGKNGCEVEIKTTNGIEKQTVDIVLSAVGIQSNIENIGLEEMGIKQRREKS